MIFLPAREGWQNFRAFKYTDVTQKQVLDALDPVPLIGFLDMTGQKDIHNFSREAAFGKHSIMAPGQLSMADGGAYLAIVPDWMRAAARPASGSIDGGKIMHFGLSVFQFRFGLSCSQCYCSIFLLMYNVVSIGYKQIVFFILYWALH